ncbi:MAG: hypothetical protein HGA31_03380 [Candidatus Moranbacteria bacterium]|nr:hypothetical protein [Candidatus Moranbacteria bacterium]
MGRISFFALAILLSLPISSLAQENPVSEPLVTTVAEINLVNVVVLHEDAKEVVIGFDLENQGTSPQPDIRYGIELTKNTGKRSFVADTYVSDETVIVSPKQLLHREIRYPIPAAFSGEYELWVVSRTTGGLDLGLGNAGKVLLAGSDNSVEIVPDSCAVKVSGADKRYAVSQGIDLAKNEELVLICDVRNRSANPVTLSPFFDTFRRTSFGPKVTMPYPDTARIALGPNEKRAVGFPVPKAPDPQAYDVAVSLRDVSGGLVLSNRIIAHYVLRGASATIQNVTLDKDSYAKGDTVTASLFWTPSADSFPDSRAGSGTELPKVSVRLEVNDTQGRACITPLAKSISIEGAISSLEAQTISDCNHPIATVTLLDGNGKTLDSRTVETAGSDSEQPIPTAEKKVRTPLRTFVMAGLIVLVAVLFLSSLGLIVWKTRGRWPGVWIVLAFAVLSGALSVPGRAAGTTYTIRYPNCTVGCTMATGTFGVEKADNYVYSYGEKVIMNGTLTYPGCANGADNWSVEVKPSLLRQNSEEMTNPCVISGSGLFAHCWSGNAVYFGGDYSADGSLYNVEKNFRGSLNMPTKAVVQQINAITSPPNSYTQVAMVAYPTLVASYTGKSSVPIYLKLPSTPINGSCGTAINTPRTVAPSGAGLCATGSSTLGVTTNPTNFTWICNGSNGGTNSLTCSAPRIVNGVCGVSVNGKTVASLSETTVGLCDSGTVGEFVGSGPWTWNCVGLNGGMPAACGASATIVRYLTLCNNNAGGTGVESPSDIPLLNTGSNHEIRSLTAHYGTGQNDCTGTDVTANTVFTGSDFVTSVTDDGAGPGTVEGTANGSGTVTATYTVTGNTDTANVNVTTTCDSTYPVCPPSEQYCPGEAPQVTNGCGTSKACDGTRQCSANWKEVKPGV